MKPMLLIYVHNGYPNRKQNLVVGSLVTPVQCACMFSYGNSRSSLGKVPKNVKTSKYRWHCPIYPKVPPQIVPQSEGEPMGVNTGLGCQGGEVRVNPRPPKKIAQTREKV